MTPENLLDLTIPLQAHLEFSVENLMAQGADKALLSVPWMGKQMGRVNFILEGASLEKRKYPLKTDSACGIQETFSIRIAPELGQVISIPQEMNQETPEISCRQSLTVKEGVLSGSREVKLKTMEFTLEQYASLKVMLKNLDRNARKGLIFSIAKKESISPQGSPASKKKPAVESNFQVLRREAVLEVLNAHNAVYRVKSTKKILTYAGKIEQSEIKIDYNPACEEAKIIRAVVVSKEGKRQEISAEEINVMDQGWNALAKRYTGGKILVANLPGVEIGSTIETEYELAFKNSPFLANLESFEDQNEILQQSFTITAPEGLKIESKLFHPAGRVQEKKKKSGSQQVLKWSAKQTPALPSETQLPPDWLYRAEVGYFMGESKTYWDDLQKAMMKNSQASDKTAELVQKLIKGVKNRKEKIEIVRDYVAKSVRLAETSFMDLPLSELSSADTTLSEGYGHAADRAILLHAMLTRAGFSPELILTSNLPALAEIEQGAGALLTLPHQFTDPLVKVEVEGDIYYLNDTNQYAELGTTSYEGMIGFSLATKKTAPIQTTKNHENRTEKQVTLSIAEDGKTQVEVTERFFGTFYNQKNEFFAELPPEEIQRYYQECVSSVAQGARPVGDLVRKFDSYPGVMKFTVEIDNFSVLDGRYLYFDVPFTLPLLGSKTDQRTLPLFLNNSDRRSLQTEIRFPKKFSNVLIAPENMTLTAPGQSGQTRITSTGISQGYQLNQVVEMNPALVEAKDYPTLLRMDASLSKKAAKSFLLEKSE